MGKPRSFTKRALIGGLLVILPVAILSFFFRWLFRLVTDLIAPVSDLLIRRYDFPQLTADVLTLAIIIVLCFVVGTLVSTRVGRWAHAFFEQRLERFAPGYRMVKEIVNQFLGEKESSPFSKGQVAKVRLFGADIKTSVTALVTSEHEDGQFTVFVPTGPNPTSGMIYHLPADQVELLPDIKVDSAMRTVISCGAGSDELFSLQKSATKASTSDKE
jgi:uncharacterized membrane protein